MNIISEDMLTCLFIAALCISHFIMTEKMISELETEKQSRLYRAIACLPSLSLILAWIIYGFPLPLFYMGLYGLRALRFVALPIDKMRRRLFFNVPFPCLINIQMLVIGVTALAEQTSMKSLLADLGYRAISIIIFLICNIIVDTLLLREKRIKTILDMVVDSEEVRSFMTFIWASILFSLIDSILCFSDTVPVYPPLFLVGSNLLLLFLLFQFILHVYTILKNRWLEERYLQMHLEEVQYEQKNQKLRNLVYTDTLTGIFSRRYAMEKMRKQKEAGTGFSLIFIDLDRLKLINDQEGHNMGDRYLIKFTKVLGDLLQPQDVFARIGGDEFIILMPEETEQSALRRMEQVRTELESDQRWNHPFSFSFGVSAMEAGDTADSEELLRKADKAMYLDKQRLKQKS